MALFSGGTFEVWLMSCTGFIVTSCFDDSLSFLFSAAIMNSDGLFYDGKAFSDFKLSL